MTFDPTISFGAILNAVVLLIGFVVAFTRLGGRIDLMSLRMVAVEEAVKGARTSDTRLVILEERVTNHGTTLATTQKDISDLRHGRGWVTDQYQRKGVDGEYP
jgi:hypothetical protein